MSLRDQILTLLEAKHNSSGGHCGMKLTDFEGMSLKELKSELNLLYSERLITIHPGAQGKIIKLRKEKHVGYENGKNN